MAEVLPLPRRPDRPGPDERPGGHESRLRDVLGNELRDERRRQQRTLSDVAEQAAVSLPYLSEVERGAKEVSSDVLAAICDALELPLDVLLERAAERVRVTTPVPATRRATTSLLAA